MKEKTDNGKACYLLFTDCLLQRTEEFKSQIKRKEKIINANC